MSSMGYAPIRKYCHFRMAMSVLRAEVILNLLHRQMMIYQTPSDCLTGLLPSKGTTHLLDCAPSSTFAACVMVAEV